MSPRRQRNRERMIQIILKTARAIMRENGVAALSCKSWPDAWKCARPRFITTSQA